MGAVGDNGDDRNPGTQGEPHEARPAGEIDLVPLGRWAARLEVAARVDQDARPARQRGPGFTGVRGNRAELAQEGPDTRHGEQEVVREKVRRRADAAARQHRLSAHPCLGHVDEARMITDQEHRAFRGQPVQAAHFGGEIAGVAGDGRQLPADEVRVALDGAVAAPGFDPLPQQLKRSHAYHLDGAARPGRVLGPAPRALGLCGGRGAMAGW